MEAIEVAEHRVITGSIGVKVQVVLYEGIVLNEKNLLMEWEKLEKVKLRPDQDDTTVFIKLL